MGFLKSAIVTIAFAAVVPAQAYEQSYYTRISGSSLTCAGEAQALAQQFSRVSGVTNVSSKCSAETTIKENGRNYVIYSVAVTFEANQRVDVYSSILGRAMIGSGTSLASGIYDSYSECLADVPTQKHIFVTHTELAALSVSCEKETFSSVGYQYAMKIDGLGQPKRRLQTFVLSSVLEDSVEMANEMRSLFNHYGVTLALGRNSTYLYYAETTLPFRQEVFAFFGDSNLCRGELDDAYTILGYTKSDAGSLTCIKTEKDYEIYALVGVWGGGSNLSEAFIEHVQYLTHAECEADKGRVVNDLGRSGRVSYGAICEDEGSGFKMRVYSVRY